MPVRSIININGPNVRRQSSNNQIAEIWFFFLWANSTFGHGLENFTGNTIDRIACKRLQSQSNLLRWNGQLPISYAKRRHIECWACGAVIVDLVVEVTSPQWEWKHYIPSGCHWSHERKNQDQCHRLKHARDRLLLWWAESMKDEFHIYHGQSHQLWTLWRIAWDSRIFDIVISSWT